MRQTRLKKQTSRGRFKRLPKGPNGGIQLLLIQSVDNLGKPGDVVENLGQQGDVVEVRSGYANNYLVPQGLATIATDHHKRMVEKHREKLNQIERSRMAGLQALADQITAQSITIEANATDDGHLYGSVGPDEIMEALRQHNFSVNPDQIRLEGPLKELGLYTIRIHIARDIEAEPKVWVVPAVSEEEETSGD